jgi:hypothetical protein
MVEPPGDAPAANPPNDTAQTAAGDVTLRWAGPMTGAEGAISFFVLLAVGSFCLAGLILLFTFVFVGMVRGSKSSAAQQPWPVLARRLLSQPEQVLYGRLVEALPGKLIFSQVQLTRILEVKNVPNRLVWLNRINRLSVDFVVCHPDSSVVAAIELDDSSHARPARQSADTRKAEALAAAGVRLVRLHVKNLPSVKDVRELLGG